MCAIGVKATEEQTINARFLTASFKAPTLSPLMILDIDGLQVAFPHSSAYPEQVSYMHELKRALDANGPALLEMPSGTGKTISLLSLITAYQASCSATEKRKLIYCSRTVGEVEKTLQELKRLLLYRTSLHGEELGPFLAVGLSARKNMCINERVLAASASNGQLIDSMCHDLTSSWSVERCSALDRLQSADSSIIPTSGVFTIDDLTAYGRLHGICPYFLSRSLLAKANVIVYSYYYLLDQKVASAISQDLPASSIVVFDEAHNIDNVCIESLSITLSKGNIEGAHRCIQGLGEKIKQAKEKDSSILSNEYDELVKGIQGGGGGALKKDELLPLLLN